MLWMSDVTSAITYDAKSEVETHFRTSGFVHREIRDSNKTTAKMAMEAAYSMLHMQCVRTRRAL